MPPAAALSSPHAATEETAEHDQQCGLGLRCPPLTPSQRIGQRGKWAAQALPFGFGALWALAMAGAFGN